MFDIGTQMISDSKSKFSKKLPIRSEEGDIGLFIILVPNV